jgi:hypothetical protein
VIVVRFFDDEPICASDDVTIETTENMTSLKIGAAKRWHCGEFRLQDWRRYEGKSSKFFPKLVC